MNVKFNSTWIKSSLRDNSNGYIFMKKTMPYVPILVQETINITVRTNKHVA